MSDLVERLRFASIDDDLLEAAKEAADKIERLRAEVERLNEAVRTARIDEESVWEKRVEELRAEIAQRAEPDFVHAGDGGPAFPAAVVATWPERNRARMTKPLYAATPQRKPLSDDRLAKVLIAEAKAIAGHDDWHVSEEELKQIMRLARAVERAHGIV